MKARKLRMLLERHLGYVAVRQRGSHRILKSPHHPDVTFAFHDQDEVGPALVRSILVKQVGLTLDEAKEVVRRG